MSSALDNMLTELKLRNYSERTQRSYMGDARRFAKFFPDKAVEELTLDDARAYQLHIKERGLAWPSFNTAVCSIRFLYRYVLNREEWIIQRIPFAMKERRLPRILSEGEIRQLINAVEDPRYRTLFLTMYVMALRIIDVKHIKPSDIDAQRMELTIRGGKGRKDRVIHSDPVDQIT